MYKSLWYYVKTKFLSNLQLDTGKISGETKILSCWASTHLISLWFLIGMQTQNLWKDLVFIYWFLAFCTENLCLALSNPSLVLQELKMTQLSFRLELKPWKLGYSSTKQKHLGVSILYSKQFVLYIILQSLVASPIFTLWSPL